MWNWVNLIAALIGAVGGPAAVYTILSHRPRKLALSYEVSLQPAFPEQRKSGGPINLNFESRVVDDPHEVNLYLRPDGRNDIKKADFDGHDLTLEVGSDIVAVLDQSTLLDASVDVDDATNTVKIAPQILKKGELVSLSILVQGKPEPKFEAKLVEVVVAPFDHTLPRETRVSRGRLATAVGAAAIMLVLSGVVGWRTAVVADERTAELYQLNAEVSRSVAAAKAALNADPKNPDAATGILGELQQLTCSGLGGYSGYGNYYSGGYYNNTYANCPTPMSGGTYYPGSAYPYPSGSYPYPEGGPYPYPEGSGYPYPEGGGYPYPEGGGYPYPEDGPYPYPEGGEYPYPSPTPSDTVPPSPPPSDARTP